MTCYRCRDRGVVHDPRTETSEASGNKTPCPQCRGGPKFRNDEKPAPMGDMRAPENNDHYFGSPLRPTAQGVGRKRKQANIFLEKP